MALFKLFYFLKGNLKVGKSGKNHRQNKRNGSNNKRAFIDSRDDRKSNDKNRKENNGRSEGYYDLFAA